MNSEKREESNGPLLKEVFTVAIVSFIASLQLWMLQGSYFQIEARRSGRLELGTISLALGFFLSLQLLQ